MEYVYVCIYIYLYKCFPIVTRYMEKMYYSYLFIIISTTVIVVIVSTPMKDTNCQ